MAKAKLAELEIMTATKKLAKVLPDARMCQNSVNSGKVHHPERFFVGKNKAPDNTPKIVLTPTIFPVNLRTYRPTNTGVTAAAQTRSAIKNR